MKKFIYILFSLFIIPFSYSLGNSQIVQERIDDPREKILELSKKKWAWIIDRQMGSLEVLFDEQIISSSPAIRMDKREHLDVIKNGNIRYSQIHILETEVQLVDNISTLLSKVEFNTPGKKELSEVKYVTEVYKKTDNNWKLLFIRINPV